jgi:AraC-like DNA-binding protein
MDLWDRTMESGKLETPRVLPKHLFVGRDDADVVSENRHFHPYWELKAYRMEDQARVVMTPPGSVHGNTPYTELQRGWALHCREPMLTLSFFSLEEGVTDYLLPWNEVDALCPGGLIGLIEAVVRAKETLADARLFNALLETLWAAVDRTWKIWRGRPIRTFSLTDAARYYIEHHYYQTELSVETVASHAGVTAGHLANMFKKDGLPTVRQYIIKVRMEHALRLLRSKRYMVKEVAAMTGWSGQFYFSNCFRRHFGVAPSRAAEAIRDESYVA